MQTVYLPFLQGLTLPKLVLALQIRPVEQMWRYSEEAPPRAAQSLASGCGVDTVLDQQQILSALSCENLQTQGVLSGRTHYYCWRCPLWHFQTVLLLIDWLCAPATSHQGDQQRHPSSLQEANSAGTWTWKQTKAAPAEGMATPKAALKRFAAMLADQSRFRCCWPALMVRPTADSDIHHHCS